MSIKTIKDLLHGRPLWRVEPDATLREAAELMRQNGVGAVAVLDEGVLAGILTERDIVFRGVAAGLPAEQTRSSEIMTREPVTVEIGDSVSDALASKLGDAFRHLPVMEEGRVVGLLSYRDIPPEYVMMFERFREMSGARADDGA